MIFNHMKLNIDRALKEYFTNHKNGKKGGAPKGNQNARKKKRPEPEQEPEEVAEDLTDEAEPVPDPEPDREPEPEPFAILKPIERRAAEIMQMILIFWTDSTRNSLTNFSCLPCCLNTVRENLQQQRMKRTVF